MIKSTPTIVGVGKHYALMMSAGLVGLASGWLLHGAMQTSSPTEPQSEVEIKDPGPPDLRRQFFRSSVSGSISGTSMDPQPAEDFLAKAQLQQDRQELEHLQDLRLAGECVLEMESALARSGYKESWQRSAQRVAAQRQHTGHDGLLTSFGLTTDQVGQWNRHLQKITEAAAEVETARFQHLRAKGEFTQRMHSLLSEDQIQEYTSYHEYQRGFLDQQGFQEYAARQLTDLDQRTLDKISQLMRDPNSQTYEAWTGPFDEPPTPGWGSESARERNRATILQYQAARDHALAQAEQLGLRSEVIDQLAGYYSERIAFVESMLPKEGAIPPHLRPRPLPPGRIPPSP